jgi:hypothetical protein
MNRRFLPVAALVALCALAVWLRVRGLSFGLPDVYNPDEVAILSRTLAFAKGDLNPHNFLYPTLYFYVLFGWLGMCFVAGWATGIVQSVAQFQQQFFDDPTLVYLAARAFSVLCGTLVVAAVWRLGRQLASAWTGAAAAAFMVVAPFAVRDAHYVKHDVPATLAVVLAWLAIARLVRHRDGAPRRRDVLFAGICCGLAASVHYYVVFVGLPLAGAILWPPARAVADTTVRVRRAIEATCAAGVGFFAGSPFLLVDPVTALRDVMANRRIVMDRVVDTGGLFASAGEYLRMLRSDAAGLPVALLALAGLLVMTHRSRRRAALLASFPLAFLLFISNTVAATRYLNVVLPFVAIFAGAAVDGLVRGVDRGAGRRLAVLAGVVVVGLAALPGLQASVALGSFFRQDDTRTEARRWIEAHVPPGSTVLVQPYSVPLAPSRQGLVEALRTHLGDERRASIKFQLQLDAAGRRSLSYRLIWLGTGGRDVDKIYVDPAALGGAARLEPLRQLGVQYVVLKGYNALSPAARPLADALAHEGREVAVFTPYAPAAGSAGLVNVEPFLHNSDARMDPALARPGPVIEVWQIR